MTPGARARRSLLVDAILAAIFAGLALSFAAGLGVVAFFALPVLLVGLLWIGVERLLRTLADRNRGGPRPGPRRR
jgi:hypothetical protein